MNGNEKNLDRALARDASARREDVPASTPTTGDVVDRRPAPVAQQRARTRSGNSRKRKKPFVL